MFFFKAAVLCFVSGIVYSVDVPRLWFSPDSDVTSGDAVTIACKVSSLVLPVTWSKNGVDVFTTSWRPTVVENLREPLYVSMFGRFTTILRGGIQHHVILTTNEKDDAITWQCRQNQTRSKSLVMKVGTYTEAPFTCGDSAGCILGITSSLVLIALVVVLILHMYKKHKSTRKCVPKEEVQEERNTLTPVPNAVSNGEPLRKQETKLINEKM